MTLDLRQFVEHHDGISVIRNGETIRSWNGIQYQAGLSGKNLPRRAKSPSDPETVRTGRHAPRDGDPPHTLSLGPDAPTTRGDVRRARWSTGGVTSVAAGHGSHRDRAAEGPRAAPAGRRTRRDPFVRARAVGDRAVYSTDPD